MKTSSCKQKGRLGQQEIVKILLKYFSSLTDEDVRSTSMGCPGEDILLSAAARKLIPWSIEVKRGKAFNLVKACKQVEDRKIKPGEIKHEAVAMGRYDRDKKWYATVSLEYLIELLIKSEK